MRAGTIWLLAAGLMMVWMLGGCSRSLASEGGQLTVIDGDTLSRDGALIALAGIDAPELGQQCLNGDSLYDCGLTAAFELQKLLILEPVACDPLPGTDGGYECHTAEESLNARLGEDGLAVAEPGSDLETAEDRARRVPLGIWRGEFVAPRAWRAGERLPEEHRSGRQCPVLGLSRSGRQEYLVPTDPGYDALSGQADGIVARFCSDEEARAAGYAHA